MTLTLIYIDYVICHILAVKKTLNCIHNLWSLFHNEATCNMTCNLYLLKAIAILLLAPEDEMVLY